MAQYDKYDSASRGRLGGSCIADTATYTGKFCAIYALVDSVLSAVVGNVTGLDGKTVKAGQTVLGYFTSVTLTSGTVILYNAD